MDLITYRGFDWMDGRGNWDKRFFFGLTSTNLQLVDYDGVPESSRKVESCFHFQEYHWTEDGVEEVGVGDHGTGSK